METLLVILVTAIVVDSITWHRHIAAAALAGLDFSVPAPVDVVASAIRAADRGYSAWTRRVLAGIQLTESDGGRTFVYRSRAGDVGRIRLTPNEDGTHVRVATETLHLGGDQRPLTPSTRLWGIPLHPGHAICSILGIAPQAARMLHFQQTLPHQIATHLPQVGGSVPTARRQRTGSRTPSTCTCRSSAPDEQAP